MKRFLFDCGTRDATASLGLFVLRAGLGLLMMFGHGLVKIRNFEAMKENFKTPDFAPLNLMSDQAALIALIFAEVVAAGMIVLGLMTRVAAFFLGFAMVVAAFHAHAADPFFSSGGPSKEMALLYLLPAVVILLTGAGTWSLDAAILREGRKRRW
jgi:putative oxidoreductase